MTKSSAENSPSWRAFRDEIEAFLADFDLSPKGLSLKFGGDPNFVKSVREGRTPRVDTVDKWRAAMDLHRAKHKRRARREA